MNLPKHTLHLLSIAALLQIGAAHGAVKSARVADDGITFSGTVDVSDTGEIKVTYYDPVTKTTEEVGKTTINLGGQLRPASLTRPFLNGQRLVASTSNHSLDFTAPDKVDPVLSNAAFSSPNQINTGISEPATVKLYPNSGTAHIASASGGIHADTATNATLSLSTPIRDGRKYELQATDLNGRLSARVEIQAPQPTMQTTASFSKTSVNPGDSAQLSLQITGNQTADQLKLQLENTVPAPLVVNRVASNSCQGTPTVNGNQLSLVDGTVPVAGCTVVLDVTWPAGSSCGADSISNTIAPGTNLQFTDADTAPGPTLPQTSSTATLACTALAVTPPDPTNPTNPTDPTNPTNPTTPGTPSAATPVPVGGLWFVLLGSLGLLGTAIRTRRARP